MSTDHTAAPEGVPMLSDTDIDRIFDFHEEAPTMEYRYLVAKAVERERDTAWQALCADRVVQAVAEMRALADSEGSRAVKYLRRARRAEAVLREVAALKRSDPTRKVPDSAPSKGSRVTLNVPVELMASIDAALSAATAPAEPVAPKAWSPKFDAVSSAQEQLAIRFCEEIAGKLGGNGSTPDPIRLLEMAEALYLAERDSPFRGIGTVAPSDEQREAARDD